MVKRKHWEVVHDLHVRLGHTESNLCAVIAEKAKMAEQLRNANNTIVQLKANRTKHGEEVAQRRDADLLAIKRKLHTADSEVSCLKHRIKQLEADYEAGFPPIWTSECG